MDEYIVCECGAAEWIELPNTDKWICENCEMVITAPPIEAD